MTYTPTAQDVVDAWNESFPIGTAVRFWPGPIYGAGQLGVTSSPAWILAGHTPVVSIDGSPGGIALTHVDPCPEDGEQ